MLKPSNICLTKLCCDQVAAHKATSLWLKLRLNVAREILIKGIIVGVKLLNTDRLVAWGLRKKPWIKEPFVF